MASSDDIDLDSIDVFQPDALDRAVTGYEENVPLAAQIVAGLTPPGMAMDIAAAGRLVISPPSPTSFPNEPVDVLEPLTSPFLNSRS